MCRYVLLVEVRDLLDCQFEGGYAASLDGDSADQRIQLGHEPVVTI